MTSRKKVEKAVKKNPGITYEELIEETGLSNGTVQYHVRESQEIVKENKALLHREACENCEYSEECSDTCIKKKLRKEVTRKVKEGIEEGRSNSEIAEQLNIDPSTVTYHKEKLENNDLV